MSATIDFDALAEAIDEVTAPFFELLYIPFETEMSSRMSLAEDAAFAALSGRVWALEIERDPSLPWWERFDYFIRAEDIDPRLAALDRVRDRHRFWERAPFPNHFRAYDMTAWAATSKSYAPRGFASVTLEDLPAYLRELFR